MAEEWTTTSEWAATKGIEGKQFRTIKDKHGSILRIEKRNTPASSQKTGATKPKRTTTRKTTSTKKATTKPATKKPTTTTTRKRRGGNRSTRKPTTTATKAAGNKKTTTQRRSNTGQFKGTSTTVKTGRAVGKAAANVVKRFGVPGMVIGTAAGWLLDNISGPASKGTAVSPASTGTSSRGKAPGMAETASKPAGKAKTKKSSASTKPAKRATRGSSTGKRASPPVKSKVSSRKSTGNVNASRPDRSTAKAASTPKPKPRTTRVNGVPARAGSLAARTGWSRK